MGFEVWYQYDNNSQAIKMAEFRFKFEAEKYIQVFYKRDIRCWYIVSKETNEISFAYWEVIMKLKTKNNFQSTVDILMYQAYYGYAQAANIAVKLFKKAQKENKQVEEYLLQIIEERNKGM